jgi:hypothetical protein
VLRAKLIYGEFLRERIAPSQKTARRRLLSRKRQTRGSRINICEPSKPNLWQLREARENNDKTRNLLPKPQENQQWRRRFLPRLDNQRFFDSNQTCQVEISPSIKCQNIDYQTKETSIRKTQELKICEDFSSQLSLFQ